MQAIIKLSFLFLIGTFTSLGQDNYTLTGKVADGSNGDLIPYATVLLKEVTSDELITGVTTNLEGEFSLTTSSTNIYLEIKFIGYLNQTVKTIDWTQNKIDLGTIKLRQNDTLLQTVDVTAERSTMEFKLDKRVFNVGSDISSTGMGAMDVLNNVPSVNVDIEGTISLRGNTGVQILIDGKPSVAGDDQSNALSTITADMIERIEVITNPSAKYNAEGTSGIINIVLKKNEKKGVNGSISLNTGYPHNHSIGGSVNLRSNKFNFFTQFGAGYRSMPQYYSSTNHNLTSGTTIQSDGIGYRNEQFYNITLGTDYYLNDRNVITLSGNFAYEIEKQPSNLRFDILNESNEIVSAYERIETTDALNPKYQYDLNYKKTFKNNEEHEMIFTTQGRFFGKDQASKFQHQLISGTLDQSGQEINTDFYEANYSFKFDYVNPISSKFTIESGAQYEINDVGNDYAVFNQIDDVFIVDSSLTNNFMYDQKVLGIYTTGSYEGEKWGIKLGLRAENTELNTLLTNTNEGNSQNYTNLFPSLHTSYKISKRYQLQAGYSRRIFRPRLWDLNPFFNIRNAYSIRTGNPNLLPEFADSYEITSIFLFDKFSLNTSLYYLYTTDVVERVSYFQDNVNISTPLNVGTRDKYGIELNGKYTATKWLSLIGEANYGYFNRKGEFEGQNFDFQGDQWSAKLTSKLKLKADIDVELTGNYQSAYKTVQGNVSGYLFADFGVRKKLWKGKAVINLAVRDVFASRIRETFVTQPTFELYDFSKRGRFITLGFSYSFGKGEAMTYTGRRR